MGVQTFYSSCTEFFNKLDTRTMFVTIHSYANNYNEVATHSICWHVNYVNAVKRSLDIMNAYTPNIKDCIGKPFTLAHLVCAWREWKNSLEDTLLLGPGNNPRATSAKAYDLIRGSNGKIVSGVKLHRNEDALHLTALFRINKIIYCPGDYTKVQSLPETLAKRYLKHMTPLRHWGQYKLVPGRFDSMTANYHSIVEKDTIRKKLNESLSLTNGDWMTEND